MRILSLERDIRNSKWSDTQFSKALYFDASVLEQQRMSLLVRARYKHLGVKNRSRTMDDSLPDVSVQVELRRLDKCFEKIILSLLISSLTYSLRAR